MLATETSTLTGRVEYSGPAREALAKRDEWIGVIAKKYGVQLWKETA